MHPKNVFHMNKKMSAPSHLLGALGVMTLAAFGVVGGGMYLTSAFSAGAAPISIPKAPLTLPVTVKAQIAPMDTVVAAVDADTSMGSLTWKNNGIKDMQIRKVSLSVAALESYPADFSLVGIRRQNGLVAYGVPDASGNVSIDLNDGPINLYAGKEATSEIVAKFNAITAGSVADGNWTDVARSGHQPAISLVGFERMDTTNGSIVKQSVNNLQTGAMVLRKSKPIISGIALPDKSLANVQLEMAKFLVKAHGAGQVAWKQMVFSVEKTNGVALADFRLRRGAALMDPLSYNVVDGSGKDVKTGKLDANVQKGYVIVSFAPGQEETVSGSGSVYTLLANVSGVVSGASLKMAILQTPPSVITGYLATRGYAAPFASPSPRVYHLAKTETESGILSATGNIVWSDLSEIPHAPDATKAPSSKDWTNGSYIQDTKLSWSRSL